jgi:hypothetical protein
MEREDTMEHKYRHVLRRYNGTMDNMENAAISIHVGSC